MQLFLNVDSAAIAALIEHSPLFVGGAFVLVLVRFLDGDK